MVTQESLIVFKNNLGLANTILRDWDDSYAVTGAKIGDTLRLRKPIRVVSGTGAAITPQNTTESQVALVTATQRNIALQYTSKEESLQLDDFSDRIIKPVVTQLANDVDADGMATMFPYVENISTYGAISNTTGPAAWTGVDVGSAATTPQQAMSVWTQAQARVTEAGGPMGERHNILTPSATASTVGGFASAFQSSDKIAEQYETGLMGIAAGAMWRQTPNVPNFTSGTWVNSANLQVNVTSVNGDSSIVVKGAGNAKTFNVGDKFVVAATFKANPLTRVSVGKLQIFTVLTQATSSAGGDVTLSVFPPIYSGSTVQEATVSGLPTSGALITVIGTASTQTAMNCHYQKNAFGVAFAPLANVGRYGALCSVANDAEAGLSIRNVMQYNILTDVSATRLDTLYGFKAIRPELAALTLG